MGSVADDEGYSSPGTRFANMWDPMAYIFGDKYRDLINKSGYYINKGLSKSVEPVSSFSKKNNPIRKEIGALDEAQNWAENKPGSVLGLAIGGYNLAGGSGAGAGAGAAGGETVTVGSQGLGSMVGSSMPGTAPSIGSATGATSVGGLGGLGGWGGGTTSGLGLFANGGQAGLQGVGGGNAGLLASQGGIQGGAGIGSATGGGAGGSGFDWQQMMSQGGGMPGMGGQQQPQQQAPPPRPQNKLMQGLGRLRDGLTPVDPSIASQMDPEYLKQLRNQAMLRMGVGMMSAAGGGANLGQALAAGLGQGQGGFGKDIENAYQVGKSQRAERRQDERDFIGDQRYERTWDYNTGRDTKLDERHDKERGEDLAWRDRQADISERRATAYERRLERQDNKAMSVAQIDKMRVEYNKRVEKIRDADNSAQNLLMLTSAPDAATDPTKQIAMVFSFQRMLEPDSVTREAEYAIISKARGLWDSVKNIPNQINSGARLTPAQIENMRQVAQMLAGKSQDRIGDIQGYYNELSDKRGIDSFEVTGSRRGSGTPSEKVIDFGGAQGGLGSRGGGFPAGELKIIDVDY